MAKIEIQKLLNVMKKLRDPQKGCPWDKKQTIETIIPHTIEEVYEVAEQVYNKNFNKLKLLSFVLLFWARLINTPIQNPVNTGKNNNGRYTQLQSK